MRSCLVTGATGFLGANLVKSLVDSGNWEITAAGTKKAVTEFVDYPGVKVVSADIRDAEEVSSVISGQDLVFHLAASTDFWNQKNVMQRQVNVQGTENVVRACIQTGVRRLVYASTMDVLGYDNAGNLIDESGSEHRFTGMGYNYGDTKTEAESLVRELAAEHGLELIVIYPGFMVGPFDHKLQLGRVFFDLKNGKLPGLPKGGSSFCGVHEVADAMVAAADHGRSGEGYICAGHNMLTREWFGLMADAVDAKAPKIVLPEWALVSYGRVMETLSLITRRKPDMNPGMARYMSQIQYYDSSKAQNELGYKIGAPEDLIGQAVDWYRSNGYEL